MSANDMVGSLLSLLIVGQRSRKVTVTHKKSKFILQLLSALLREGLIRGFKDLPPYSVSIFLKYDTLGFPLIEGIERFSLPSKRVYLKLGMLQKQRSSVFVSLLSTSLGVLSSREALLKKVGGELLCTLR